jgi:Arc/MetJ-type ribon-helix-helix transcriptional regulator
MKEITISLPEEVIQKLENKIRETDFENISEYINYVLDQVLEESKEQTKTAYTEEEEEAVKNRLKELGYI